MNNSTWASCSSCKRPIAYGATYYVCSVSTCRGNRTGLKFCSVPCWDAHVGVLNHRNAWAEEATAPRSVAGMSEARPENSDSRAPVRKVVQNAPPPATPNRVPHNSGIETDTLVVVSKVKKLIKDQSGFNTSQCCIDALTKKVIEESLKAISSAREAGRKTVMGRDVN